MKRGKLIAVGAVAAVAVAFSADTYEAAASGDQQTPSFRARVDLVRVNAIVRDRKGRFVRDLTESDFEVLDNGQLRKIADFRTDSAGITVALLMDVSGSMEGRLAPAREAAQELLAGLDRNVDEAGVFMFDTRLEEVTPFAKGVSALPDKLTTIRPFGATSLHDAIAQTAERMADRIGQRAVVVLTDGKDNASKLTPGEVSAKASAIDVPVYIVGIVPGIDNPTSDAFTQGPSALSGALNDLATWTGGHTFVASTALDRTTVMRALLEELRHQYLISFESSGQPGWHPLVVRTKQKDLVVRARSGYHAGQSRPIS
jgi:Ca-activated chloride channel family protein